MKSLLIPTALLLAGQALLSAGEHIVTPAPFEATIQFDGTVLPVSSHALRIDLDRWSELKILDVKEQGGTVKKGEGVVSLDLEGIDRKLDDNKAAAHLRALGLANAERELANLKISTAWKLEVAARSFARTKEDLAYFKDIGRPMSEESSARSVDRAKRSLANQQEELTQLLKMYQEDDLTEETEEIILTRQRNAVKDSNYMVKRSKISSKHHLAVALPRQAADLEQGFKDAELTLTSNQDLLPRALEQKTLETERLRVTNERAAKSEAEVISDRGLMEPVSPVDGRVYYGEIKNGKWNPAGAAKFMKVGGLVPARTVYATVVAEDAPLELHAFVSEAQVMRLQDGQVGQLAPIAAPRHRLDLTLKSIARYPAVDGTYHAVLTFGEIPEDLGLVTGMKGKVTLITTSREQALTVPAKALHEESDGSYSVKVKLADGASESRVVVPGVESAGKVEILSGLEAGQVVLVEAEAEGK